MLYLFLLFSLVICLGSVYWFILSNKNNGQQNEPAPNTNNIPESIAPETNIKMSLTEVIIDLKSENCHIVNTNAEVYLDNPHYIRYEVFKLKALETKIVALSPSDSGPLLITQSENIQWIWIPT